MPKGLILWRKLRESLCLLLAGCVALSACSLPIKLAETPTLYQGGIAFPADEVPPALRTVEPVIYYVTDRQPELADGALVGYGAGRSASMAFGEARVRIGDFERWADLVDPGDLETRKRQEMRIKGYTELLRFPETPLPAVFAGGRLEPDPTAEQAYKADIAAFQETFAAILRMSPRREAVVFIHGVSNDMDDALTTMASLWHHAGRIGVPVSYSWPAGNKGLTAYFKDRESGEFSTYHLKEFLRALAAIPELETITLIAHSRGADVATSAIRELAIFETGAGRDPRQTLKIGTLILAAPDLDFGVVQQRLGAEGTAGAIGQVNIYLNPNDGALGVAQALATGLRVGRLSPESFSEAEWAALGDLGNLHFIDVESVGGRIGHAYFRDNPAVMSDVILTLRTRSVPGTPERPLENVRSNFWRMHPNYPGARITAPVVTNSDR